MTITIASAIWDHLKQKTNHIAFQFRMHFLIPQNRNYDIDIIAQNTHTHNDLINSIAEWYRQMHVTYSIQLHPNTRELVHFYFPTIDFILIIHVWRTEYKWPKSTLAANQ